MKMEQDNDRNNQDKEQGDKARQQPGKEGGYQQDQDKIHNPGRDNQDQTKNK